VDRGIKTAMDISTFEILPKESTTMAGRGPAAFLQYYDEMAHVVKSQAHADAEAVYESATPALDQFGVDGFIYAGSSPWQMMGKFYELAKQAAQVEPNGSPAFPEKFILQLASWEIYEDWERADEIPIWPEGKVPEEILELAPQRVHFQKRRNPPAQYDEQMKRLERANPTTFRVERRSKWAAALNAYLSTIRIAQMFEPWSADGPPQPMQMQKLGILNREYRAHGDPSKVNANFGFAIAHVEQAYSAEFDRSVPHVVFDFITAWVPGDYPRTNFEIPYGEVEQDIKGYLDAFMPSQVSFDQFNSISIIENLNLHAKRKHYPKRVSVFEKTATAQENWRVAETFKSALNLGLVHSPYFELLELEATYLQDLGNNKVDHPDSGPVQTKDVWDCCAILVHSFLGEILGQLLNLQLGEGVASTNMPAPFASEMDPFEKLGNFNGNRGSRSYPYGRPGMSRGQRPRPGPRGY
jgi:hypothetical protein